MGRHEKSRNKESPNKESPNEKSPELKIWSGPDSPPQALGHREHSFGQQGWVRLG